MKHIFIIYGEPKTGKSTLFQFLYRKDILIIDDFVVYEKNCKDLIKSINKAEEKREFLTAVIITNCKKEDLHLLVDNLKTIPGVFISICEVTRV